MGQRSWQDVVVECERILGCEDTAETPTMSNLPNLVREAVTARTELAEKDTRIERLTAIEAAARGFYAMVKGESPSLLDDDFDAIMLESALSGTPTMKHNNFCLDGGACKEETCAAKWIASGQYDWSECPNLQHDSTTTKPQAEPDLGKKIAAYAYWTATEGAARACENIGKEIVCPEECAAVIRALADKPTTAKLVPVEKLLLAFVDGAKWWEFEASGGTMWQADQHRAFSEAELRSGAGTLGITVDERVKRGAALREEEI